MCVALRRYGRLKDRERGHEEDQSEGGEEATEAEVFCSGADGAKALVDDARCLSGSE